MPCKQSNVSYKNQVAFVQSETIFEHDTRIKYLKIEKSQFLSLNPDDNDNEVRVFDFIKNHACKNKIYKFVLHIDSGTLSKLIDHIAKRKEKSTCIHKLFSKCTLVATYSNADYVRQQNVDQNTQIYFSLSPLSTLLSSIPDGSDTTSETQAKEIMVVVSDTVSPYYGQVIANFQTTGKTVDLIKVSELNTVAGKDKLNNFASNNGYLLMAALDTLKEFETFGSIVVGSTFVKQVMFIELTQPEEILNTLVKKVSDVQIVSSGVCVNATGYELLNRFIPYEKCAAALTVTWHCWEKFKEANILSMNVDIPTSEEGV